MPSHVPLALAAAMWTPAGAIAADKALGEYLSSECVTCHQLSGRYEGIPPIVGWPEPIFIEVMQDYRAEETRQPGHADDRGPAVATRRSPRSPPISAA